MQSIILLLLGKVKLKIFISFLLLFICIFSFAEPDTSREHLTQIIENVGIIEKTGIADHLKLSGTASYASDLIKWNHRIRKDKNVSIPKKIGVTLINVPAVPIAFAGDVVLGSFSKALIKSNHKLIHDKNKAISEGILKGAASSLALVGAIPVDIFIHYVIKIPSLACSAVNYLTFKHPNIGGDDLRDTRAILTSIKEKNYRTRKFNKLVNEINAEENVEILNRPQIASILAEAIQPNSPVFKEYLTDYREHWKQRKNPTSVKDNILRFSPETTDLSGAPIGLKEMAILTRMAYERSQRSA